MGCEVRCGSSLVVDLPDCSVQCVVTSPPYWGLRKYDGEQDSVWGDSECEHEWATSIRKVENNSGLCGSTLTSAASPERRQAWHDGKSGNIATGTCIKCGAWRGAYGLEPTPEMYVAHTVLFLREIRRVLKDDGVVWWNVADSYWGSAQGHGTKNPTPKQASNAGTLDTITSQRRPLATGHHAVLKPKDMCLIPFRVKIAAQADGWWVRSDIIWAKPNPMPESVRDRPTSSYEHIFLFTKSKDYYWDQDAVREPMAPESAARYGYAFGGPKAEYLKAHDKPTAIVGRRTPPCGRNLRDVWTIATQPSGFKHYASFPEEIPTRCIKAATSQMGECPKCGKPWVRVTEKSYSPHPNRWSKTNDAKQFCQDESAYGMGGNLGVAIASTTLGWEPSCDCGLDPVPQTVLDPFCGTGRTLYAAQKLGRDAVGYDLSEKYCEMARQRCGLL